MSILAKYGFNEGTGTTSADLTGNGHTATLGSATWTAGKNGGGITTVNTSGASMAPYAAFDGSWSFGVNVRLNGLTSDYQSIIEGPNTGGATLYLEVSSTGVLDVFYRRVGDPKELDYPTPLTVGTWYHIAVTYAKGPGSDNGLLSLYVNGTLSSSIATIAGGIAGVEGTMWAGGSTGQPGRMTIDDLSFFNHALTSAEVLALSTAVDAAKPFITSVGSNRRLLDQFGAPILIKGDAPWSALANTTPEQWETYCTYLESMGFNLAILDLVPLPSGGGAYTRAEGETYNGLKPFVAFNNWSVVNEAYWARVDAFISTAATHGITMLLCPAYSAQGMTTAAAGTLNSQSTANQTAYGTFLGNRYKNTKNVAWIMGGDWGIAMNSGTNAALWASQLDMYKRIRTAIKAAGDTHLWTAHQTAAPTSDATSVLAKGGLSYDQEAVRGLYDFDSAYSYTTAYQVVRRGLTANTSVPTIFAEGNYSGENNQGGPATTDETMRRTLLWSYTSGAAGDIIGTDQWRGQSGWVASIPRTVYSHVKAIRSTIQSLEWWKLTPDTSNTFLTSGQGTQPATGTQDFNQVDPLESTYATASIASDGTLGLVYVPTARSFTINTAKLGPNALGWRIDPTTGTETALSSVSSTIPAAGNNAAGQSDWLYKFTGDPLAEAETAGPTVMVAGTETPATWTIMLDGVEVPVLSWSAIQSGSEVPLV